MKHILKLIALICTLAVCLNATALAESVLTVTGSAQVNAPTDYAVIHLAVQTRANTPSDAQADNNRRAEAVMKALTETCGIAEDKIATSDFGIYSITEWNDESGTEKIYYQVNHQMSVTVDNIDQTGTVIDVCVAAGANNIQYISFASSRMKEAYDQALEEAVADARRKAEILAAAAGMKLGKLSVITSGAGSGEIYDNSYRVKAAEEDAGLGATRLAPGTQSVTANVSITWTLEP